MNCRLVVLALACVADSWAAGKPIMSPADIIAFRRPKIVSLAPDGGTIAFTIREGRLVDNRNTDTVCLLDAHGGQPRPGLVCDRIDQLAWDDRGRLYCRGSQHGRFGVWRLDANASGKLVFTAPSVIRSLVVAGDGSAFYYSTTRLTDPREVQRRKETGFVYDWTRHSGRTIVNREYAETEWEDVWEARDNGEGPRLVHSLPYRGLIGVDLMHAMAISPGNKHLAIVAVQPGDPAKGGTAYQTDLVLLDLATGEAVEPLPSAVESERTPCWCGDGELIFTRGSTSQAFWRYDLTTHALAPLDWVTLPARDIVMALNWDAAQEELQIFGMNGMYRASFARRTVGPRENIQTAYGQIPAVDRKAAVLATVSESSTETPEVALYDLATRRTERLTRLNPSISAFALGSVEKLRVQTGPDLGVDAYLVHPAREESGRRYPLIVATYGFTGKFITDAEWHSSFPAQTFAGEGYAVLLMNLPPSGAQTMVGDPKKAQEGAGWNKVRVFERACEQLVERGLVDPEKIGIYGWSMGTFASEFLLAHTQLFKVASVGEGGDYNPGMFWAYGSRIQAQIFDNLFGGPPWGESLEAYLGFSPFFQVEHINSPLLMEFDGGLPYGLEMYVPLRYRGVPAELVLYEGEEHNFVMPRAREASMIRKLDWFNFWLLDRVDPDPAKARRYERWRKMRSEWEASRGRGARDQERRGEGNAFHAKGPVGEGRQ